MEFNETQYCNFTLCQRATEGGNYTCGTGDLPEFDFLIAALLNMTVPGVYGILEICVHEFYKIFDQAAFNVTRCIKSCQ